MNIQAVEQIRFSLAQPGWTPGRRDMSSLFQVWRSLADAEREGLVKKLTKIDAPSVRVAVETLPTLDPRTRGDLARPLLKSYLRSANKDSGSWSEFPLLCLGDVEPRVRKASAQAIGSSWDDIPRMQRGVIVEKLIDLLERCEDPSEKKALLDALGKSGDQQALDALKTSGAGARNLLMLERDISRDGDSSSDGQCHPERLVGHGIVAWFTAGLDAFARTNGLFLGAEILAPGVLRADAGVKWLDVVDHYLWRRAGVAIGRVNDSSVSQLASVLVQASAGICDSTERAAGAPVRIRLGRCTERSRSFIWEFAEALSKSNCGMINDGRGPHWEVRVVEELVVLVPLKIEDKRFSWRDASTEGASDPTIAAALVMAAGIKPGERVWDPFCGAGTELILAAKVVNKIVAQGTDINQGAIDAAAKAAHVAGADVNFAVGSCLDFEGAPFDVIVTNPPFGMRTVRGGARTLLEEFFLTVRKRISADGRIVLLSHAPSSTLLWAREGGLRCVARLPIKLGGMDCQLQVFRK